jgi:gamma-glutamylputrescine oxidase
LSLPDTYYARVASAEQQRPALNGDCTFEVCIVGAGLAGLSTALELARRGRRVCVLEARHIAWGASGRNGGFVSPGYSSSFAHIARRVGDDAARALHRLSIEGADAVAGNLASLGIRVAQRTAGILAVARHEATASLQAQRDWLERAFDYRLEFRSREQVQAVLSSARYFQGLYNPHGFHMQPLNYARALAQEIERLGGAVFEATRATALDAQHAVRIVSTAGGQVRCQHIVIACGGYSDALVPELKSSFLPIATYVMLTIADRALIERAIRTSAAIGDHRRAGDYYRLVEGGERILWGGRITTRTSEPNRLARLLHRTMVSTYPQLQPLRVDLAWSGLMAYARHLMPQIGCLREGLWYCTAFGGHGLNTTAIGGRVLAEAIAGESDRYRQFEPFGLRWNGGIAGRMAVQASYWSLQALDWLHERRAG